MKEWWTTKAWPWLQANWRWILFPIGALLFLAELASHMNHGSPDPLFNADGRAAEEKKKRDADDSAAAAARATALAAEQEAVKVRLAAVHKEHQKTLQKLNADQMAQATTLEGDPEALNAFLRSL